MDQQLLGHIALSYSPIIDRNRNANTTRLTVFPLMPGTRLDAVALLRTLDEVWPVGDLDLFADLGLPEEEMEQILDDMDAYPDEMLDSIIDRIEIGDEFARATESARAVR